MPVQDRRLLADREPHEPCPQLARHKLVQVQNRMLMGASDTYPVGSEGGEAQHTLTVSEIPSHQHQLHGWAIQIQSGFGGSLEQYAPTHPYDKYDNTGLTTRQAGEGQPHNNLPPYRSVHIWRRTA